MDSKEATVKLYEHWKDFNSYIEEYNLNNRQLKCMFLSSAIIGITTYDDDLSIEIGEMILETLIQIKNKTTFKYIEDKDNYRKYILSCNFIEGWLEWGSSIRGAWFDIWDGKIRVDECMDNIGYKQNYISITEDFIHWFIDWLSEE